jgi:hypothetical protein
MSLEKRLRDSVESLRSCELDVPPFRTVSRRRRRRRATTLGLMTIALIAMILLVSASSLHRATVSVISPQRASSSTTSCVPLSFTPVHVPGANGPLSLDGRGAIGSRFAPRRATVAPKPPVAAHATTTGNTTPLDPTIARSSARSVTACTP